MEVDDIGHGWVRRSHWLPAGDRQAAAVLGAGVLHGSYFFKASLVTLFTRELGGQISRCDVGRQSDPDHPSPYTQHVHVVVLDALTDRVRIVADGRPDSPNFICGDGRTHATAADHDATIGFPTGDGSGNGQSKVRIVVTVIVFVGAEVVQLVAVCLDYVDQVSLERKPTVISAYRYYH